MIVGLIIMSAFAVGYGWGYAIGRRDKLRDTLNEAAIRGLYDYDRNADDGKGGYKTDVFYLKPPSYEQVTAGDGYPQRILVGTVTTPKGHGRVTHYENVRRCIKEDFKTRRMLGAGS